MKIYRGTITNGEEDCFVAELGDWKGSVSRGMVGPPGADPRSKRLNPRYDLANHSPDGFSWGYNGSGPAQLALAILANHSGAKVARVFYQQFKAEVIAKLPQDKPFQLTENQVSEFLSKTAGEEYIWLIAARRANHAGEQQ